MKKEYSSPKFEMITLETEQVLLESNIKGFDPLGNVNETDSWDW